MLLHQYDILVNNICYQSNNNGCKQYVVSQYDIVVNNYCYLLIMTVNKICYKSMKYVVNQYDIAVNKIFLTINKGYQQNKLIFNNKYGDCCQK